MSDSTDISDAVAILANARDVLEGGSRVPLNRREDYVHRSLTRAIAALSAALPHLVTDRGEPSKAAGDLNALRQANIQRQAIWCPDEIPDLSFRGNELGGEVGEALNVIKKLERERLGWRGSRDTVEHLAEELADVVICADLCALSAGVDLASAVVAKFNATSEKVGIPVKLTARATLSASDALAPAAGRREPVLNALLAGHTGHAGEAWPDAAIPAAAGQPVAWLADEDIGGGITRNPNIAADWVTRYPGKVQQLVLLGARPLREKMGDDDHLGIVLGEISASLGEHADRIAEQLTDLNWRPNRAHLAVARNTMQIASSALAALHNEPSTPAKEG